MTEHDDSDLRPFSDSAEADHDLDRVQDRLFAMHADLVSELNRTVDLDEGLAKILPGTTSSADSAPSPVPHTPALRKFADLLDSKPAHERFATRSWMPLGKLAEITSIAGDMSCAGDLALILAHARDLVLRRDQARDRDLTLALARALDSAFCRTLVRDLARALILDLDRTVELAHALVRDLDGARDLALALVRAQALDLDSPLGHDLARARASAAAFTCARARAHARADAFIHELVRVRARDLDLDGDFDLGNDFDAALAYALTRPLDLSIDIDLDAARANAHSYQCELVEVVAYLAPLDLALDLVDSELVKAARLIENAVTNATDSDMTKSDLSAIPLRGLIWSTRTKWPDMWRERVRAHSEKLGPDLYEIQDDDIS